MSPTDWRFWSTLCAATIFLSYSAAADCDTPKSPEAAIIDCTQSINSGKWKGRHLAAFYSNRATAYHDQGDNDRAIADYNEVIGLDPEFAAAFLGRGVAYSDKGDNDRAISDFSEVIRLDPKLAKAFLSRGIAYGDKGDNDRAIADFSEAIRLDPKDAVAFVGRGGVFSYKGDFERAIADYSEAIRLDPKDAFTFVSRGGVFSHKGDFERAIADYNEAIRLNPKLSLAYFARGRSYLFAGSVEKALADLDQASARAPENAYLALWVDIVTRRNNLPSRLAQTSSRIDMTVWPAPVIRLFMDQTTPAAVLAAADDPDATRKKGKVCAANFYSGELSLTKGLKDEATRLFRLAANDCPHIFNERDAANAELKALGVVP
jgi:tetratricopeptide (TPR) repeat protein